MLLSCGHISLSLRWLIFLRCKIFASAQDFVGMGYVLCQSILPRWVPFQFWVDFCMIATVAWLHVLTVSIVFHCLENWAYSLSGLFKIDRVYHAVYLTPSHVSWTTHYTRFALIASTTRFSLVNTLWSRGAVQRCG